MRPFIELRGHALVTVMKLSDNQHYSGRTVWQITLVNTTKPLNSSPQSALL